MKGFILIHRGWRDNPVLNTAERRDAWLWMLEKACWKPTRFNSNGVILNLERGQFVTSYRLAAAELGMSKSTIERFFTRLKTETMIGTDVGTGQIVVTICNYEKYQVREIEGGTPSGTPSGTGAGQERDTKERRKQIKEDSTGILPLSASDEIFGDGYAFEGSVIKLNQRDLEKWKTVFHAIPDIPAELFSLDQWLGRPENAEKRKSWFNLVSGALNKKHQTRLADRATGTEAAGVDAVAGRYAKMRERGELPQTLTEAVPA